jgi:hypothetical protein
MCDARGVCMPWHTKVYLIRQQTSAANGLQSSDLQFKRHKSHVTRHMPASYLTKPQARLRKPQPFPVVHAQDVTKIHWAKRATHMHPSAGEVTVVSLSDTGSQIWNRGCPLRTIVPISTMKLTTPFEFVSRNPFPSIPGNPNQKPGANMCKPQPHTCMRWHNLVHTSQRRGVTRWGWKWREIAAANATAPPRDVVALAQEGKNGLARGRGNFGLRISHTAQFDGACKAHCHKSLRSKKYSFFLFGTHMMRTFQRRNLRADRGGRGFARVQSTLRRKNCRR